MRFRSLLLLAFSVLLLICLVACGGSSGSNNNSGSGNPPGTGGNSGGNSGGGGSGGGASSPAEFLYVSLPSMNSIAAFQIDTNTGALTPVSGSPFVATGQSPSGMAVHPSGKFLYGTNPQSPDGQGDLGTISAYTIAANGALAPDGSEVKQGSGIEPFLVAVSPNGNFVYTVAGLSAVPSGYTVDSVTGQLTPMSSTKGDFQDAFSAGGILVNNDFVYESFLSGVDAFPIGADGRLTDTSGTPALIVGNGVGRMAFGPGQRFIYAIGTGQQLRPDPSLPGTLVSIAVSSTGALSLVGTALPFQDGSDVAVNGNFLYALNKQGISAFAIDPNSGALTQIQGSPFALPNQFGLLQVDPSGKFLYAATAGFPAQLSTASTIAAFSIDSAGALHAVAGSPFPLPAATGGLTSFAVH